jgi:hypothetical protein
LIDKKQALDLIWRNPIEIGHWVGFKDLTSLHNEWLRSFLYESDDQTLQAHRGSFKTTTLSLFFAIHCIIKPNETLLYFRKTGSDVAEVARQTANILGSGCMHIITQAIYGKELKLIKASNAEIQTNLSTTIKGMSQIVGLGIYTSITGKHADIVVTDDIVNVKDRISTAERENTKIAYMELQNIKNRGGRFINTGTPWHKEDAFTLMPNPIKYDCYTTGLMSDDQIDDIRSHMSPSLFAANYELKHIADDSVLFPEPPQGADPSHVRNGVCQLDSAFYGEDYTAFTIMVYEDHKYYILGKVWRKHVEDCYGEILRLYSIFACGKMYIEKNADKGMVARDLRNLGIRTVSYDESMNKHIKIATYLKAIWSDVEMVEGTDPEYIEQICDYSEDAEHDDAPDSASVLARMFYPKIAKREGRKNVVDEIYGKEQ